jgi:anti-sigma regulatory factor (Ser/Thr protein kinase)
VRVDEKPIYEGTFTVTGGNFDNAGEVSSNIKSVLKRIGLSGDVVRKASLVAYESEINIVSYARKGMIRLRVVPDCILIEAIDEGQGIADIELAMQPGYSTATERIREMGFGAGMGLCNIKSFSDTFLISSEVGKGTHLKMIIKTNHSSLNS